MSTPASDKQTRKWQFFRHHLWEKAGWLLIAGATLIVAELLFYRAAQVGWANATGRFFTSPGAGGLAAVCAAGIAYKAVRAQLKHSQNQLELGQDEFRHGKETAMESSWWERFEWATTRALPSDKGHEELPYDLSLSILTSLATHATNDIQGKACGGFVDHLKALKDSFVSEEISEKPTPSDQADADPTRRNEQHSNTSGKLFPDFDTPEALKRMEVAPEIKDAINHAIISSKFFPNLPHSAQRDAEAEEAYARATGRSAARSERVSLAVREREILDEIRDNLPDSIEPLNPRRRFAAPTDGKRIGYIPDMTLGTKNRAEQRFLDIDVVLNAGRQAVISHIRRVCENNVNIDNTTPPLLFISGRDGANISTVDLPAGYSHTTWDSPKDTPRLMRLIEQMLTTVERNPDT